MEYQINHTFNDKTIHIQVIRNKNYYETNISNNDMNKEIFENKDIKIEYHMSDMRLYLFIDYKNKLYEFQLNKKEVSYIEYKKLEEDYNTLKESSCLKIKTLEDKYNALNNNNNEIEYKYKELKIKYNKYKVLFSNDNFTLDWYKNNIIEYINNKYEKNIDYIINDIFTKIVKSLYEQYLLTKQQILGMSYNFCEYTENMGGDHGYNFCDKYLILFLYIITNDRILSVSEIRRIIPLYQNEIPNRFIELYDREKRTPLTIIPIYSRDGNNIINYNKLHSLNGKMGICCTRSLHCQDDVRIRDKYIMEQKHFEDCIKLCC